MTGSRQVTDVLPYRVQFRPHLHRKAQPMWGIGSADGADSTPCTCIVAVHATSLATHVRNRHDCYVGNFVVRSL